MTDILHKKLSNHSLVHDVLIIVAIIAINIIGDKLNENDIELGNSKLNIKIWSIIYVILLSVRFIYAFNYHSYIYIDGCEKHFYYSILLIFNLIWLIIGFITVGKSNIENFRNSETLPVGIFIILVIETCRLILVFEISCTFFGSCNDEDNFCCGCNKYDISNDNTIPYHKQLFNSNANANANANIEKQSDI